MTIAGVEIIGVGLCHPEVALHKPLVTGRARSYGTAGDPDGVIIVPSPS